MNNKLIRILIFLFTALFLTTVQAQVDGFDVKQANKKFDELSIRLSTQNLKLRDLTAAVEQLETLQGEAKDCIEKSEAQFKTIDKLLKSIKTDQQTPQERAEYRKLQSKRAMYSKELSECRLFVFRSEEALKAYKKVTQDLAAAKTLKRSAPIWEAFEKATAAPLEKFDVKKLVEQSGWQRLTAVKLTIGFILLLLTTVLALYLRSINNTLLKKGIVKADWLTTLLLAFKDFIVPIVFFATTSLFLLSVYWHVVPRPTLEAASYIFLSYFMAVAVARFFLLPFFGRLGRRFFTRLVSIATLLLLGYLTTIVFKDQEFSLQFENVIRATFTIVLSAAIVWLGWLFCELPWIKQRNHFSGLAIKSILSLLLVTLVTAELLGFHNLAVFIMLGFTTSVTLLVAIVAALWVIKHAIEYVDSNQNFLSQKIRYYLGVRPHKKITELIILKFALYLTVLLASMPIFLQMWGGTVQDVEQLEAQIIDGFVLGGMTIVPSRIVIALIIFTVLHLVGRFLAALVARQTQFEGEKDTQVAVASIISYGGFAVALLVALLFAGVNFTGLAIIAGALSVGIGLGLQNIVNNFVSGIILLLEKPIQPGDRVVVGTTEGFVKRIRIRSTQIHTSAKEDVIVPNSDLITTQVTNFMFRDKLWRVVCKVGVAYGSDVELTKKLLLEVAAAHPKVIQEGSSKPLVLFDAFGESALLFELWVIIHDVNQKYVVGSDLNFAIDKAFRQNQITIAFPQRDVHIKDGA